MKVARDLLIVGGANTWPPPLSDSPGNVPCNDFTINHYMQRQCFCLHFVLIAKKILYKINIHTLEGWPVQRVVKFFFFL